MVCYHQGFPNLQERDPLNAGATILTGTTAGQALAVANVAMSLGRVRQTALADLRRDTDSRIIGLEHRYSDDQTDDPQKYHVSNQMTQSNG
jgi:hypothetical protein